MSKKKEILNKIKIVLTQKFKSPEDAFSFFDKNSDGVLDRSEVKKLLKKSKVNSFLRGVVTTELLKKFDANKSDTIAWNEFKKAVKDIA